VLALLALPLSNLGFQVFGKYADTLQGEATARETTRIEVATLGLKAAAAHPFLGCGPGCFGLGFQTARKAGHDRLYINIAHNDPLEVAVELGFPGLALWLLLVGCCLAKPYRLLREGRRPVTAGGAIAAVLAITTYSLFNFVLTERPVLWAELFLFGLALSLPSSRLRYRERGVVRILAGLWALVMGIAAVRFGYNALRADSFRSESQMYYQQLQVERAMQSLDLAIALQPSRATLRLERAQMEEAWAALYPNHDGLPVRLQHLQAAYRSSPADLGVLTTLAQAYLDKGETDQARRLLEEAQTVAPFQEDVRERREALAIREGDLAGAIDLMLLDPVSARRDKRLVTLLLSAEQKQPDAGVKCMQKNLQNPRLSAEAQRILAVAVEQCQNQGLWPAGLRLASLEKAFAKTDLCVASQRAMFIGKVDGALAEWTALSQSLSQARASRESCYGQLLLRWSELGWQLGKRDEVRKRLESDLEADPRISLARLALGELLRRDGKRKESIELVRKGLDFEPRSGPLLQQLGSLYEEGGSRELALGYYSDAARVEPNNETLKAKVAALKKGLK
jgi:tetratricopeptide (TPR) repeat protein